MTRMTRRDSLMFGAVGLSMIPMAGRAATPDQTAAVTKVYEHTFLKAKPGMRGNLGKYIAANWFAMDQRGLEQGIFTSYWLLEETGDNDDWDYVMVVGYPTELGYGEPRATEVFQTIRRTHSEAKVGGKGLAELGDIVGNHRLKIVER